MSDRRELLERHGRCYGELRLALAFTIGIDAADDEFKVAKRWELTKNLADGDHGAALLGNRGLRRNAIVVLRNSNLLGLDIDGEGGMRLCRSLVPEGFPPTVVVRSGRGMHLWYRPPADYVVTKYKIEFKSSGRLQLSTNGYLLVPPSVHAEAGVDYEFLPGAAPWEQPIAVMPPALLERLTTQVRSDDEADRADDQTPLEPGQRHAHLRRIAGAMRRAGAGAPAIEAALLSENARRGNPPKPEHIVRELARDIARRYPPGAKPS